MRCNLPLPKSEGAVLLLHQKVIRLDQLSIADFAGTTFSGCKNFPSLDPVHATSNLGLSPSIADLCSKAPMQH